MTQTYCPECQGPDGDHRITCKTLDVPQKCETCGAILMITWQYQLSSDYQYQQYFKWDEKKKKFVEAGDNTDMPSHAFLSCPNYDDDEETCVVDGEPVYSPEDDPNLTQ